MDRIVYLAGGRAASGTTSEVVRSEVLSGLYGHHVDVIRVHGRILVVAGSGDGLDIPPGHYPPGLGEQPGAQLGEQVGHGQSLSHGPPDDGPPADQP
jgi:hypothetical protein